MIRFDFLYHQNRNIVKSKLLYIKAQGTKLGKPKGTLQKSMYDKDLQRIEHLYNLGVPIRTIIETHLKYGKYLSLKTYIDKKIKKNLQSVADYDQICIHGLTSKNNYLK
mgnify:CR=1 FL=1